MSETVGVAGRVVTPLRVHLSSLVLGLVLLLLLGRDQWFAYDDWSILHRDFSLWDSHQGHWTTVPTLAFQALRDTVGLHSYLPYLALAIVAHLATVHLIWRVSLRAGVHPWWATGLTGATILLGSAAENLFWAFQVGYMGAIAVALVVVLLMDRATLPVPFAILAGAVAILSLPFSGTALPVLVAAAVLGWVRRGLLRTLPIFVPAAVIYLVWYWNFARGDDNGLGVHGLEFLTRAPLFFATMFGADYGQFTGVLVLGPAVAIALVAWLILARRRWLGREAVAYVLIVASAVFAALTAVTRGGGELSASGAQRYVYVIVMLAIPTMGLAVAAVAGRGRIWRAVAVVVVVAVGVVNVTLSVVRAGEQAVIEQTIDRQYSAAASLLEAQPSRYSPTARPLLNVGAPDVTMGDIQDELEHHMVTLVRFTKADLAAVETSLRSD